MCELVFFLVFFSNIVFDLVGGGSVINGAYILMFILVHNCQEPKSFKGLICCIVVRFIFVEQIDTAAKL